MSGKAGTNVNNKEEKMYKLEKTIGNAVDQYVKNSDVVEIGSFGLKELGLDFRCGRILISVNENFVAACNPSSIEYYGGWEYIDSEFKLDTPEYRFYDGEADRVYNVINNYRTLLQEGYRYDENKGFVDSNGIHINNTQKQQQEL